MVKLLVSLATLTFAAVVLITPCVTLAATTEISLYGSDGRAAAYIDTENDATIYLWNGKPVAYVYGSAGDGLQVWGFNGKHIGWLERGILHDHDGNAVCVTKNAYRGLTELEPLKSLKELRPLKSLRELAPLKPLYSLDYSDTPCSLYLMLGIQEE